MNQKTISQNFTPLPDWPARAATASARPAGTTPLGRTSRMLKSVTTLAALAGMAVSAGAQTVAFTNNPVATTYGGASDNGPGLNIGNTFNVSGAGIEVFQLGAFDWQGDGLAAAHTVTLFHNQTALASVLVPAGTAAPLLEGFRFAPLASPLVLPAGNYAVVTYQLNGANAGNDPYGENNAAGFNGGGNVSPGDGIYQFTLTGSPLFPNNDAGGYNFASASFTYNNLTATASTWTGAGANNNWSAAANWNAAPTSPANLTFAGTARLVNNNDLVNFVASSLTFDAAAGAFVLNGNGLALGGSLGFNGNPATPVTQTINLNLAWSSRETLDTPTNGNLTLGGAITSGNDLLKLDAGTLTLGGTNAIESLDVDGGTNTITGITTLNGNGGSGNYNRFYVGDGDAYAGCNGTLVIQPGAAFNVTGNFSDSAVIGRDGGSGTVIQNGGTFNFNPANQSFLIFGATSETGTRSVYDLNGGLLNLNGNNLGVGLGNGVLTTGLVNQVSGTITNAGSLQLGTLTANGYGVYNLAGGSIYIEGGGITSFSGIYAVNLGGGTVGAEANWTSTLNLNLTGVNGPVTFDTGAGNTIALLGTLSGNGGLTVIGSGTLDLSGIASYTGATTVSKGSTLELDSAGSNPGVFYLAGGATLNLTYNGTFIVAGLSTNGVVLPVGVYNSSNLPGFIVGSGSLTVVSGVSTGLWTGNGANNNWSTAGNWNQSAVPVFPIGLTFAGTRQLVNNNDLTGITANRLTFDAAAGSFVLNGNGLTLNGNLAFNGNPATPVTQTVNLNLNWNPSEIIDTPANGNLVLNGDITSTTDTSLIKLDTGTLTLGGTNEIASWDLDGGTTIITGNTTINGDGNSRIYVGNGDYLNDCNGTLIVQPGATLSIIGDFADSFVIGRDSGSGTVIQNGGTFTFNPGNQGLLVIAATGSTATRAEYDMNGGVFDLSGNTLTVGWGNLTVTGLLNQVNGTIINVGNLRVPFTGGGNGLGVYNLAGGSIYIGAGGITSDGARYAINLGGGTVGADSSWFSSLNFNLTNLNGSVTFDTAAGNTITLSGVLSGSGGLNVIGTGTLELSGINTYVGDTTIQSGSTLQLDTTGSSLGAFHATNGATLNLNFSGIFAVPHFYTNGVALPVGIYNAGNLPQLIAGSGSLQVASSISTGLWTGNGANNNWSTSGNWDQNAVPIFPIGLTFAGARQLANINDLTGLTASSITFDAAAGPFVLDGNGLSLNGTIGFNGNPAAPVTQTVNLDVAWNANETIDTPTNGNLSLGGAITTPDGLVKLDAGTLTLGGVDSVAALSLNGGTTIISGNVTINGTGGVDYLGDGDAFPGSTGTLILQNGAAFTVAGNLGDSFVIGRDGGSGKVIQNGGTFTYSPGNQGGLFVGATSYAGTQAEYDLNGGLLDLNGNTLGVALGDRGILYTGIVNQVSGQIINVGNLQLGAVTAYGYGVYTLSGGSIYLGAGGITTVSGRYAINLGGGTVGASASWSSSLNLSLTGLNGPVTFDTAGNTITLSGTLSGPGGLVVIGAGILDLSATVNYAGDTLVNAGTLQLDTAGNNLGAVRLANGALLDLTYAGTDVVSGFYTNGVALPAGVYTAASLPGFITGNGSVTVQSLPTTPTAISYSVSGGQLTITWPANYAGWILQSQTNTLRAGLGNHWVDVAGSASVTSARIPINPANPVVFYRLRYPSP